LAPATAGIIDSQSVKNVDTAHVSGYDAAKQIKGIKRHIVTDTLGLVLEAMVRAANIQDRDGAKKLLLKLKKEFKSLKKVFADQAYAGELIDWVERRCGYLLQVVKREGKGFNVLRKRWIVELPLHGSTSHGGFQRITKRARRAPRHFCM
jgi:putative transposase